MNLFKLFQMLRRPPRQGESTVGSPESVAGPLPSKSGEASRLDRLEIQNAITMHLEWRMRFNELLSQEDLPPSTALPDAEHCGVGQWLVLVSDMRHGQHPAFADLLKEHLHIHACAAEALEHARNNRMDLASTLLNTRFERSHRRLVQLLSSLQEA